MRPTDPSGRPLAGQTIAITRQRRDGAELEELLVARGARVVWFPAIRRAPPTSWAGLDRGLASYFEGAYDGLLLTSPAAVESVQRRIHRLGKGKLPPTFVGAVGPGTGRAAGRGGMEPSVIPSRHDGVALAAAVAEAYGAAIAGRRFLQPRAEEGREELSRHLRALGAQVDVVAAYRTVPAPEASLRPLCEDAALGTIDAVIFASPSAVEAVHAAWTGPGPWLGACRAIAIGETTAGALRLRGVEGVSVATEATDRGLLDAVLGR